MRLEKFRVTNYRSVRDSGWISTSGRTAVVGGNESGKTNLLRALEALNPPEPLAPLSVNRDFPADLLRSEYSENLDVVQSVWLLAEAERAELADVFPRARDVARVEISRGFEPEQRVLFCDLAPAAPPIERAKELVARVEETGRSEESLSDPAWERALEALGAAASRGDGTPQEWAAAITEAFSGLQQPLQLGQIELAEDARAALEELGDLAAQVANDSEYENAARQWVLRRLPAFLYLDEYPMIEGHQNLAEFLLRLRNGQPRPGDAYFEMLLRVGGIDAEQLESLLDADHETRRQLASRAGAALTRRLRALWSDRALKVRFNIDGEHFDTLVADPTALYDVEVNLNERSRGFQWFFSFWVMFAAGEKSEAGQDAILLLDEPGLHLHAVGQRDLLDHLAALPNQVVFATQSPFMVPTDDLAAVRTVSFSEEAGTTVSNELVGDQKTLLPVFHALGAEVAKGLFGSEPNLVVADVTDYWYLRTLSHFLAEQGNAALPKGLQITPAGGATRIPYLVTLLADHRPETIVLLPETPENGTGGVRLGSTLLERDNLVLIGAGLAEAPEAGADIEDLLDPEMYDRFVRFAYRKELGEQPLEPDAAIPRVVRRYEQAFAKLGIEFSRARPARLILRGAAQNPQPLFPKPSCANFERLFGVIRARFEALRH